MEAGRAEGGGGGEECWRGGSCSEEGCHPGSPQWGVSVTADDEEDVEGVREELHPLVLAGLGFPGIRFRVGYQISGTRFRVSDVGYLCEV